MPDQLKPIIHGRDHLPDGADPIPNWPGDTGLPGVAFDEYVQSFSSLLGYWRLGEASSPFADTSGRFPGSPGNATRVTRGVAYTPDQTGALPAPDDDGAILFNSAGSAGDYLDISPGTSGRYDFGGGNPFTVTAWVKVKAHAGTFTGAVIHNRYSSPPDGWALHVNWPARTVTFFAEDVGGSAHTITSPSLTADTWYLLTGVYDHVASGTMELFINGVSVGTTATGTLPVWSNGPQIGGGAPNGSTDYYFYGTIDEVAIFDEKLDDLEIAGLYLHGTEGSAGTAEPAGTVFTSDGAGGTSWAYPTVKVDGARYDEILTGTGLSSTDNADGTVTLDATATGGGASPTDTAAWMPLTTVTGGTPELVWDADDSLIPTLTPI